MEIKCQECKGKGKIYINFNTNSINDKKYINCPICKTSGKIKFIEDGTRRDL